MSRHVPPEELVAFADGELGAEDAARVRAHLDSCQECRAGMSDMAELGALVTRGYSAGAEETPADPLPDTTAAAIDASLHRLLPSAAPAPTRDLALARDRRRLTRVLLLGGALAAALVIAVSLPLLRSARPVVGSAALSGYSSDVLVRGATEHRFFLDVTLGSPSHLALLAVDLQGRTTFLLPHDVFGDFGLAMPLPADQPLRIPPTKLQDFAEDEVRDRLLILIPTPEPLSATERASLAKLAAQTAQTAHAATLDALRPALAQALPHAQVLPK